MIRRAWRFTLDYGNYVRALRCARWTSGWLAGLLDEIMESRVSQLTVVLGLVGISGAVAATFSFMVSKPFVPLVALSAAVVAFLVLTMYGFNTTRGLVAQTDTLAMRHLDDLLELLVGRSPRPRQEIGEELGISTTVTTELVHAAIEANWIEIDGGAVSLAEGMRPLAQRRISERNATGEQ